MIATIFAICEPNGEIPLVFSKPYTGKLANLSTAIYKRNSSDPYGLVSLSDSHSKTTCGDL